MRLLGSSLALILLLALALDAVEQNPPVGRGSVVQPATTPPQPAPAQPGRGGRGGRGAVQVMTLTTSAWPDGGQIPAKYTQAGEQVSPALSWTNAPENVTSFVLIMHDIDAATGNGTDDMLHWMLWNIPPTTKGLAEGVAQGSQLPD